jgi:MYXO-CTERM domain-containing protein
MKSIATRLAPSFAAVTITFFAMSGTARADVLPPDSCASVSDVGQSCNNAGTNYDQPGTCVSSTCPHASPPLADGAVPAEDAGTPCALCQVGATTQRPDSGTTAPTSSSSGCAAAPTSRDDSTGFVMIALGLLGLAFGRRNRA